MMSANEKYWGHYIPKTKGDDYIQHCVMLWRKSKQYPDWIPHLLSYVPYDKLDSCMIWMQAIDSECGNVRNWDKQDERDIHDSLGKVCKSISAILHILHKLPSTKQMEYSLVWDDFSEEYVDVQFLPEIVEEGTNAFLSDQIVRMLKYDMEPMMVSSIVGIIDPIEKLSIPFVDKNSMAHHFLDKGLNMHQVEQILADHYSVHSPFHEMYPVQVTRDMEMYRFSDYPETHIEFRYDEGVNAVRHIGIYDSLHQAVLVMFSQPIERREPPF